MKGKIRRETEREIIAAQVQILNIEFRATVLLKTADYKFRM
jgi:hypothetical protein